MSIGTLALRISFVALSNMFNLGRSWYLRQHEGVYLSAKDFECVTLDEEFTENNEVFERGLVDRPWFIFFI
tara:strand:- start:51 stop:263 length:213 start_codon:yes stop_codon:yes gene_type:complete